MKVGIIGGSIAGLTLAILLQRQGIEVFVFERSAQSLAGRGAGIVLPENLIQQCIALDLFDKDIPRILASLRTFKTRTQKEIFSQGLSIVGLNWADIYSELHKRYTQERSLFHEAVIEIKDNNGSYEIKTTKGNVFHFDLLIAADGIDSLARKVCFPEVNLEYAGYVAWRGTIPLTSIENPEAFADKVPYFVYPKGHLLFYYIPSPDFAKDKSKLLNWVMYEDRRDLPLKELLIDHAGKSHGISLPPGSLRSDHISHLHAFAKGSLPSPIAKIICDTPSPFLQAIFDAQVPEAVFKNICFVGDAAAVLRPHTVSGVLKALTDGMSLAKKFESKDLLKVRLALKEWDLEQNVALQKQVALSKTMGQAMVTSCPLWEEMTPLLMEEWWKQILDGNAWYATPAKSAAPALYQFENAKTPQPAAEKNKSSGTKLHI